MTNIEYATRKATEELKRRLEDNRNRLEAWENVELVSKKDGKPFQTMQKNFKNAYYKRGYLGAYHFQLAVYGTYRKHIEAEEIDCFEYVDTMTAKNDARLTEKPQNIMPKEAFTRQMYNYDFFDICDAIERRKEHLRAYVAELEKDLSNVAEIMKTYGAKFEALKAELREVTHCNGLYGSSLYYIINETRLFNL